MDQLPDPIRAAADLPAPRHPVLVALRDYWQGKAATRALPARSDIDPAEIKPLLPHVMLYDVLGPGSHRIRLVGGSIVQFVGRNMTGLDATTDMPEAPAATMREILDGVAATRAPRFRAGKAWWWQDKSFRDFEACFLPLAPDGRPVDIILAGVVFDT